MEILLEFLIDNIVYILASVGTILAITLGKPKTAEKLEQLKQKKIAKLTKKGLTLEKKLEDTTKELQEISEKKED